MSISLTIGAEFGRYEILDYLGRGGMGSVYKVRDTLLDQVVAIKVLNPAVMDARRVERFKREVLLARRVVHEGICRIHDLYLEDDIYYISMEYIEGPTLTKLLGQTGALPQQSAARLVRAICSAVAAAHAKEVLHRDLKPSNIIVRGEEEISVLDFGVGTARDMARITEVGSAVGTFQYMAPEIARGGEASPGSDIYSLGVILYCCLTGHHPFHGNDVLDMHSAVTKGRYIPPRRHVAGLVPALDEVVHSAMALEPELRFQRVDELERALTAALQAGGFPPADHARRLPPPLGSGRALQAGELAAVQTTTSPITGATEIHSRTSTCGDAIAGDDLPAPSAAVGSLPARDTVSLEAEVSPAASAPERPRVAVEALGDSHDAPTGPLAPWPLASAMRWRRPLAIAAGGVLAVLVALYATRAPQPPSESEVPTLHPVVAGQAAAEDARTNLAAVDAAPAPADAALAGGSSSADAAVSKRRPEQELRRLVRRIQELRRSRGIIADDCPRCDALLNRTRTLQSEHRFAAALREGERALRETATLKLDAAFVDRKLLRFNAVFDTVLDEAMRAKLSRHTQECLAALDRNDFEHANRQLNSAFQLVAASR